MNFDFTDDQQAIKRTANELLAARFKPERVRALYDRTLTDLRALPGVEAAAVMSDLPVTRGLRLGMRLSDGPAAGA